MTPRVLIALAPLLLSAQSFTQRGFLDLRTVVYPQTAPGDSGRSRASRWRMLLAAASISTLLNMSPITILSRLAVGDAYTSGWNIAVFAVFSIFYLKQAITVNHLIGFSLIAAGAAFVFRS